MSAGERVSGRMAGPADARERSRPGAAGPARPRAGGTAGRDGLAYWLDVPYTPRAPLEGDVDVDACVIGAGVAGLSCARRLALHGLDTLVLERDTVASGASGRNGGFLLAGVAAFHNDARERYGGERARRIYGATLAAQEEIYALAAELGAGDVLRRTGLLRLAVSPEEAEHVRGQVDALPVYGTRPTGTWRVGESVEDKYEVSLAADAPPGEYRVEIGLYLPTTFQRLQVVNEDDEAIADLVYWRNGQAIVFK